MDTCTSGIYETSVSTGNNECKDSCQKTYESEVDSEYEGMRRCTSECNGITVILSGAKKCVDACPSQLDSTHIYALN